MAGYHGSKAVFTIEDAGGTARDISAYLDSTDLQRTFETADTTGMGGVTAKTFVVGPYDSKVPIKGTWDDAATTGSETVLGGLADAGGVKTAGTLPQCVLSPAGTASGRKKYTFNAILQSYNEASPNNGKVNFSGTLQISGAVTPGTN